MMTPMGMLNDPNHAAMMQQLMQQNQAQQPEQNPMGMLSKILPLLMAKTGAPTSVMGSGGPLTVPAGSQINQMDPNIMAQLRGRGMGGGGGNMGLLGGMF